MRWAFLAAVLAFLVPATAAACSCAPMWMIAQSELADTRAIVFVGTVEGGMGGASTKDGFFMQERLLRVRPHFFLRGSWPPRPVEVWGGSVEGWGDCGAPLREGWTYLVFAYRSDDGKLSAGRCSLTAPLFGYGILIALFAVVLLVAGVASWGLWRLLHRWLPARMRADGNRLSGTRMRLTNSPLAWLASAIVLVAVAVLLWILAPRLPRPVAASVCNGMTEEPLERVEAQLMSEMSVRSAVGLGRIPPGDCRTARLPIRGEASLRLTYQLRGTQFTVQDPELGYVESGYHLGTSVQGPGKTQSWTDMPEPSLRFVILLLGIYLCLSGALAALCCAAWVSLQASRTARSAQRQP